MDSIVAGLFQDTDHAEQAVRALKSAGFRREAVGIALKRREVEDSGLLGGVVGLLMGAGVLALADVGPVVTGGALASVLGEASDGVVSALIALGVDPDDARHFGVGFEEGGTLLTVNAGVRRHEALVLLRENGADIGSPDKLKSLEFAPAHAERRNSSRSGRRDTDMQRA